MNSRFNIITAVTDRIECILEAVCEFMLPQMAKSKSNSCNRFNSERIVIQKKKNELEQGSMYFNLTFENTVAIASS